MNTPRVMITVGPNGSIGGPHISHSRIINSRLKDKYTFIPLTIPSKRLIFINPWIISNMVREIKRHKPDIFHFAGLQLQGFNALIAWIIAGKGKSILAVHGSSNEAVFLNPLKRLILKHIVEKFTVHMADHIYAVSEYVSKWDMFKRAESKFFGTIYNLPPEKNAALNRKGILRMELGIHEQGLIVVSVGRITREKGYDIMSDAINQLQSIDELFFIIVGDGEFLKEMKENLSEPLSRKKIHFLGARADVQEILSGCDIFVLPSRHETLSIALLEAAVEGLPLIGANIGGIPEIIQNGYNGILMNDVTADNIVSALKNMIANRDTLREMGENAKIQIRTKFDREKILDQIDELYTCALSHKIRRI